MKIKKRLSTIALATTFLITSITLVNAQEITNKEEILTNYNYDDIKSFPSKITFDLTNPNEVSTYALGTVAFGQGGTFLNQDGMTWYGSHYTSVTNGKLIFSFSVIGELLKKPKGSTSLILLDQDSDTIYAENDGIVLVQTFGNTGVVGDTMRAKSYHSVNLGWAISDNNTVEEVEL
ncbi:hypothetical protein [Metasolibacillus sp. FSL K6-0083]|uniref:hypothetical protein n=1 Tax=Metasolibacillus sp. FSL K6-0083 TaxID=2921416 RepID=UPI00315A5F42